MFVVAYQVTNQMVKACKAYITDKGLTKIWDLPREVMVDRLNNCVRLYKQYRESFYRTKRKIDASPEEKPFEFSEMYIFGKYDAFCKRVEKIIQLLNTVAMYSTLLDCRIEGTESLAAKFMAITSNMKKKPYNVLEHRKTEFDVDFDEFRRQIGELDVTSTCIFTHHNVPNDCVYYNVAHRCVF